MRITASNFGLILQRKKPVNDTFLNFLFNQKEFSTEATHYGKSHEASAKETYLKKTKDTHIHDCGLVVDPAYSFLGATPDGKVYHNGQGGVLEIKCPYSARNLTISEAVRTIKDFSLSDSGLKRNHPHYFQCQVQLLVTGAAFCHYVVYTSKDIFIEKILPDEEVFKEILYKLSSFYAEFALPFLSDLKV